MTARVLCIAPNPSIDRLIEVERLVPGTIHRPTLVRAVAGGKGLNVARAAVALGASVTAVGILAGHGGRWLAEALGADGVTGRFTWTKGESRICTSIADTVTGTLTEVYEAGPTVTPSVWSAFESEIVGALAGRAVDVMTISGSLPPGAPPDGHARLVGLARDAGVPAAIDGIASGARDDGGAWAGVLEARPWLVKANLAEVSGFANSELVSSAQAIAAAQALVAKGASGAVVTLGVAGAVAAMDGAMWRIGPPSDLGAYPVGSGDAFLAGLVVGYVEGVGMARALALGAGAGAANALVAGAGTLDGALAHALARSVRVDQIG